MLVHIINHRKKCILQTKVDPICPILKTFFRFYVTTRDQCNGYPHFIDLLDYNQRAILVFFMLPYTYS